MTDIRIFAAPRSTAFFGQVCNFVAQHAPFDRFEFGLMVKTLRFQIAQGTNLCVAADDALVAYLGWIRTTEEIASAWSSAQGPLHPHPDGPAVAVTVLATQSSAHIMPLIREAKRRNPDQSVFWKREFTGGRGPARRAVRKRTKP